MTSPADGSKHTETIAQRASQGDQASIEEVLVQYLPRLRSFIRGQIDAGQRLHESVSDLVQSTCREVLEAGPGFAWQGEPQFRGWLFTAALNKIRGRLRHHNAKKRGGDGASPDAIEADEIVDPWAAANSPSRIAVGNEASTTLELAMESLSPDHREVIALSRLAELPHAEIARVMGRSEGAVRTLLSRALVELVAAVDKLEGRGRADA